MNFYRSGVERNCFDLDTNDLLKLQLREHAIQYAIFGPTVHAHINRVPAAEPLWKAPPLTALFRHVQNRVQYLQVGQTYVSALHRQAVFDADVLFFRDLHPNKTFYKIIVL